MAAGRHFFEAGTHSDSDLKADIESDIQDAHKARRDCERNGQVALAGQMGKAVDGYLDELNDLNNGTWKPQHSR